MVLLPAAQIIKFYHEVKTMSVKSFIDSSMLLYEDGFYDTSLCMVCMALDRCAKSKYPHLPVGKRYKQFIIDNFNTICQRGFPGISANSIRIKVNATVDNLKPDSNGYVGMEDIIYHVIRCGLVHDCEIDKSIQFTENTIIGDWNNNCFKVPKTLIWGLIDAVNTNKL